MHTHTDKLQIIWIVLEKCSYNTGGFSVFNTTDMAPKSRTKKNGTQHWPWQRNECSFSIYLIHIRDFSSLLTIQFRISNNLHNKTENRQSYFLAAITSHKLDYFCILKWYFVCFTLWLSMITLSLKNFLLFYWL